MINEGRTTTHDFKIRTATSQDDLAWDEFVRRSQHSSIYHLSAWRNIIHKVFGNETRYFLAYTDTGETVGVLPLVWIRSWIFGNYFVSMPHQVNYASALGKTAEIETALMESACQFAEENDASHIEFRDLTKRPGRWPCRHDKVVMQLNLPESEELLWNSLKSKTRAQIKRPLRENVGVNIGGSELVDDFYQVFAHNMRDLGSPVHSKQLFDEILRAFPSDAYIIVIKHDHRPVAAAFLLGFHKLLEIPWASSIREYNRLSVNMLLYWEVLKSAVQRQYMTFDFGRSTLGSGTFRFKKQWGAEPIQLNWHYWMRCGESPPMVNPHNPKYRIVIKVWQKLPLCITNRIGPHVVKNLP